MKCPSCNVNLVMTERKGVEIDYCPDCRGVWLDRGELDKIIERSAGEPSPGAYPPPPSAPQRGYNDDPYYYKRKKRESFLGDLFDF